MAALLAVAIAAAWRWAHRTLDTGQRSHVAAAWPWHRGNYLIQVQRADQLVGSVVLGVG